MAGGDSVKSPAWQFYAKQWLGDDQVLAMDWDARGMHLHFMCLAWQSSYYETDTSSYDSACTVPDDDALLRKWAGNPSEKDWSRIKAQIFNGVAWKKLPDGRWRQDGLHREFLKQKSLSESRSKNINARWEKERKKKVASSYYETPTNSNNPRNTLQSSSTTAEVLADSLQPPSGKSQPETFNSCECAYQVSQAIQVFGKDNLLIFQQVIDANAVNGQTPEQVRDRMVISWENYKKAPVEYRKGAAKFFGDGEWLKYEKKSAVKPNTLTGFEENDCRKLCVVFEGRDPDEVRKELASAKAEFDRRRRARQA